ncbi:MAG: hypothetical protein IJ141_09680 [Lachnospiraceae bacterium]|nr:hypothetical protein [Lachnospiraceae bacterium]
MKKKFSKSIFICALALMMGAGIFLNEQGTTALSVDDVPGLDLFLKLDGYEKIGNSFDVFGLAQQKAKNEISPAVKGVYDIYGSFDYKNDREYLKGQYMEVLEQKREESLVKKEEKKKASYNYAYTAPSYYMPQDGLTPSGGVNYYGEQKETYYNLNMNGVVNNAQSSGIEGDYWVREDGVKMYGEYVIVAANQDVHPYGTTVDTSLGEGIVLDTGSFAAGNPTQVDIATAW